MFVYSSIIIFNGIRIKETVVSFLGIYISGVHVQGPSKRVDSFYSLIKYPLH